MARPRKNPDDLHDHQYNVNFTRKQAAYLKAWADMLDEPMQNLLRSIVVNALENEIVVSLQTKSVNDTVHR